MAKIIKNVPKGTTKSVAALVCPPGLSRSLPDERPSSWYISNNSIKFINLSNSMNFRIEVEVS